MFSIIYYTTVLMTRIVRRRTSVARDRMKVSNRESPSSSPISLDHQFLRTFFTNSSVLNSIPCWFSLKAAVCRWFSRVFSFLFSSTQVEENLILKIWNGWIVCQIVLIMTRRYMCIWWPATNNYPVFCPFPNPHNPDWSLQWVFFVCLAIRLETTICIATLSVVVHKSTYRSTSV